MFIQDFYGTPTTDRSYSTNRRIREKNIILNCQQHVIMSYKRLFALWIGIIKSMLTVYKLIEPREIPSYWCKFKLHAHNHIMR